ncbi:MAG: menaquinone biosynthetic enzyme MqnA/MqnD family protein [Armatimonadota bacterium]
MKIGSVPYLNARPLVEWFDRNPLPEIELEYAIPSVLVQRLLDGTLDVAMASTFATLEHPELRLLPGMGVTATGPAWSVRLLSRVPPAEIRTLALDAGSRSTNALARIILADRYGVTPECMTLPPSLDDMLAHTDAAVLIGDIGISASGEGLLDFDLGQEWFDLTGLPFFFAGWIARDPAMLEQAAPYFHQALDYGLVHLDGIADSEAKRLNLPRDFCYRYLTEVMRYRTTEREEAGLAEFRVRAERLGLLEVEGVKR